jgi:DnaJ-class molecular chaperone
MCSRTKAKTMHPDVGGSEEQMAALNEAYEVLSDEGECETIFGRNMRGTS